MKSHLKIGVILFTSLLSISALAESKAPAVENKITRNVLAVSGANDEWTPTTLKVTVGDILLIRAEGTVTVGSYLGQSGPDGVNNGGVG